MQEANPDGSIRRLVRHHARCECGGKSEVYLQEHGKVTVCMACAVRNRLVTKQMLDVLSNRFPDVDEVRAPQTGKGTKKRDRVLWQ